MSDERIPDTPAEAVDETLAEVSRLVARAGLVADTRQARALASLYQRLRPALDALRSRLDAEVEPGAGIGLPPRDGRADCAGD